MWKLTADSNWRETQFGSLKLIWAWFISTCYYHWAVYLSQYLIFVNIKVWVNWVLRESLHVVACTLLQLAGFHRLARFHYVVEVRVNPLRVYTRVCTLIELAPLKLVCNWAQALNALRMRLRRFYYFNKRATKLLLLMQICTPSTTLLRFLNLFWIIIVNCLWLVII